MAGQMRGQPNIDVGRRGGQIPDDVKSTVVAKSLRQHFCQQHFLTYVMK